MIPEIGFVQQCLSSVWPEWKINRILGTITAGAVYEISRGNSGDAEAGTLKFLYMENNPDLFSMNMQSVINMMLQLKGHPHIASIEDYSIRKNEKACIVMIRTERLLLLPERMRLAPLKREDVIRLGLDICNALSFCEQKQAIHGNIEINTIYYSEKTGFKLDDFMLFRAVFSAQEETFTDGINSLLYLAPEVYLNGKADNKSDIYSLGLVLYVLLNDFFLPFVREYHEGIDYPQVREACRRRLSGETFSAPKNADESLARVIMRACSSSPENRFPSAYEFGKALNSCLRNTIPNRGTADETVSILSFYNDDKNTFDFSHAFYDNDQNTPDVFPGFTDDSVPPC